MPTQGHGDTGVFRWLTENYRIVAVCVSLLVGGAVAWSNVNYRVAENCAQIERNAATVTTEMTAINTTLETQDGKLDAITKSVDRLLVIREREDRGY